MLSRRTVLHSLGASAALGLGLPSWAQNDLLASIRSNGKIRVALEFGRPPWGFKDSQLKMTGSDMESAELLARDLGVKLEIVEVTGPSRVPFL